MAPSSGEGLPIRPSILGRCSERPKSLHDLGPAPAGVLPPLQLLEERQGGFTVQPGRLPTSQHRHASANLFEGLRGQRVWQVHIPEYTNVSSILADRALSTLLSRPARNRCDPASQRTGIHGQEREV